jgi:carbonic anhydrase/acetyltransferase-like protein (isoleucine patch superfamily)
MIHQNVKTDFSPEEIYPIIHETAYVHPQGAVIGNVSIHGKNLVEPGGIKSAIYIGKVVVYVNSGLAVG